MQGLLSEFPLGTANVHKGTESPAAQTNSNNESLVLLMYALADLLTAS